MHVWSYPDRETMGEAAGKAVASGLREVLRRKSRVRVIFAAAPSQSGMLAHLTAAPGVDWARVTAFHMDEYVGLPAGAPERFSSWMSSHLAARVTLGAFHALEPEPDPLAAARAYAGLLAQAPIDLVCLGIGVNGHLAFNDPPVADLADPEDVKSVELDPVCRRQQVDDGAFASVEAVPLRALTLTIPRLLRAGRLFCTVPGARKRDAVRRALYDPIGAACPATALRTHPDCTLFLDGESDPRA